MRNRRWKHRFYDLHGHDFWEVKRAQDEFVFFFLSCGHWSLRLLIIFWKKRSRDVFSHWTYQDAPAAAALVFQYYFPHQHEKDDMIKNPAQFLVFVPPMNEWGRINTDCTHLFRILESVGAIKHTHRPIEAKKQKCLLVNQKAFHRNFEWESNHWFIHIA